MSPSPEPTRPTEPTEPTTKSTPNPKKRTYDSISTNSIHKPFRSPLRQNPDAINQTTTRPTQNTTDIKPGHQPAFKTPVGGPRTSGQGHENVPSTVAPISNATNIPRSAATTSTIQPQTHAPHPTLAISHLRTDIDTLQQSLRLLQNHNKKHPLPQSQQLPPQDSTSTSPTKANMHIDTELENLISKWRSTARLAAEELYGTARDKVNQMGGMSGWRAREEANVDRRRMWEEEAQEEERKRLDAELASGSDEDEEGGGCGEGAEVMGKAEKKMLRSQARESRRRAREAREEARYEYDEMAKVETEKRVENDGIWTGGGANRGDAFTMDMMLKSMGIDLKIIGWDCDEQRWTD